MVKQVTTTAAIERLKKTYQRKAGSWALQHLGHEQPDGSAASFPLHPPTQQQAMANQQTVIDWVASWRAHPKLSDAVVWDTRHWSLLGRQDVPLRLEIPAGHTLASIIGKTDHWTSLLRRFESLLAALDSSEDLRTVLTRNADGIVALTNVDFQRLVDVLGWLGQHPASELYIRQLPVRGVDTKWIEANRRLVTTLHRAHTGHMSLGIAAEPSLWRIRLLDNTHHIGALSDVSAPLDQLAALDVKPRRVLIVENLISLLTLPAMQDTIAIFGRGTAVPELAKLPWLASADVYYWGDLDTHGLRILHTLRAAGVDATSLLMDLPTLQQFHDLWAQETKPFTGDLDLLTTSEAAAYDYLRTHPGTRLEQERIDWSQVLEVLRARGFVFERLD